MGQYIAQPVVNKYGKEGGCVTMQVPTFYVDAVNIHAARSKVHAIVNPTYTASIYVHTNVQPCEDHVILTTDPYTTDRS